jgi:signal peptidase I
MNGTKTFILAIAAALVLKLFFFDFIYVQGQSMEPAIKDGTVLVISRLSYGIWLPFRDKYLFRWAQPKPGEIVVFFTPEGDFAVKRCITLTERGGFYAEGDNKNASYDSRSYGPVPVENITGRVLGY